LIEHQKQVPKQSGSLQNNEDLPFSDIALLDKFREWLLLDGWITLFLKNWFDEKIKKEVTVDLIVLK
jgi:hypothetical protein